MHQIQRIANIIDGSNLETLRAVEILINAEGEYAELSNLFTLDSLKNNELMLRKVINEVISEYNNIDIFTRLNSIYKRVKKDKVFEALAVDFKQSIIPLKSEYDKLGYVKNTSDIKAVISLLTELNQRIPCFKEPLLRLAYHTMKDYLLMLQRSYTEITREIDSKDLEDFLDGEQKYKNVKEYKEIVNALFSDITILELLDISESAYKLWDKGCSRELYVLTKVGMNELHKRELLMDDDL